MCTVFVHTLRPACLFRRTRIHRLARDLEAWLNRLVREDDPLYTHTAEGPDDMPSHIKAALTATTLSIPIVHGRLGLGTWQGIYLWEHRRRGSERRIIVHVGG